MYKDSNEIAISKNTKRLRWRTFGYFLHLMIIHLVIKPSNIALKQQKYLEGSQEESVYYFTNSINYIAILSIEDLKNLKSLAADRNYCRR